MMILRENSKVERKQGQQVLSLILKRQVPGFFCWPQGEPYKIIGVTDPPLARPVTQLESCTELHIELFAFCTRQ